MAWADRFSPFVHWQLYGWCAVCALWLFWEVWGASHANAATFTFLVRNSVPRWGRVVAWLVLGWHFLWYDAAWWRALTVWLGKFHD